MKKTIYFSLLFLGIQAIVSCLVLGVFGVINADEMGDFYTLLGDFTHPKTTVASLATASMLSSAACLAVFLWRKYVRLSPMYLKGEAQGARFRAECPKEGAKSVPNGRETKKKKPVAVFFWTLVMALGAIVPAMFLSEKTAFLPDFIDNSMRQLMSTEWGYFAICLFAPLVEEAVFRGAVLGHLLKEWRKPWAAIAVSALVFAVIHLNPAQMPYAFLAGGLLGWLFYRTGSILPGVLFHWVNNTFVWVMCQINPLFMDMRLVDFFQGDGRKEVLAMIFSLMVFTPALLQVKWRTDKVA